MNSKLYLQIIITPNMEKKGDIRIENSVFINNTIPDGFL